MKSCLDAGLIPVLCIGETLEQRQEGLTFDILNEQLVYGLEGVDGDLIKKTIIAYEPVWAIGTGMSATAAQAQESHAFIRHTLKNFAGDEAAKILRVMRQQVRCGFCTGGASPQKMPKNSWKRTISTADLSAAHL